jgi:hypothetical protein
MSQDDGDLRSRPSSRLGSLVINWANSNAQRKPIPLDAGVKPLARFQAFEVFVFGLHLGIARPSTMVNHNIGSIGPHVRISASKLEKQTCQVTAETVNRTGNEPKCSRATYLARSRPTIHADGTAQAWTP